MDQVNENLVLINKAIHELTIAIKAIRVILYKHEITSPGEVADLQREIREMLAATPGGQLLDSLLKEISGTQESL
jgi:hypothetical protein